MTAVIYILSLCVVVTVAILLARPIKFIVKLLINSVLGCILILLLNTVFPTLCIGINPATAAICGFLGVPGVILLVLIKLFI